MATKVFYAYPSFPPQIGMAIQAATKDTHIKTWEQMDIFGGFIRKKVLEEIRNADLLIGDITQLNLNVVYEIGYAIGKGRNILLTKNRSLSEGAIKINEIGIFDSIGYIEYENSGELHDKIIDAKGNFHKCDKPLNTSQPVYLLDAKYKDDFSIAISSRIKKAKLRYRSFDPSESPRLSASEAIDQVAQSFGVVIPLLSSLVEQSNIHNMRAAFIAGIAGGMNKVHLLIQHGYEPVPMDFRDIVEVYQDQENIQKIIADFANKVVSALQKPSTKAKEDGQTLLQQLELGASAAENEMQALENYYLKTDSYLKSARGEAQIVCGRKGSGKSAIFLRIRDRERVSKKNTVLDLKPEGYQLIKFKEMVLDHLEFGTFQHTITAFWEYLLLLELCHKVLIDDRKNHINNDNLFTLYRKLDEIYKGEKYLTGGDFSERMISLMEKLEKNFKKKYEGINDVRLTQAAITELLYNSDIKEIRTHLTQYLKHKDKIWILFDNLDKGWPSDGLMQNDLIIIRSLLDASRKIHGYFTSHGIKFYSIIFLRNDVFELLVENTADRQKEAKVSLDWSDPDLLREMLRLRLLSSIDDDDESDFFTLWQRICISHINGEESSSYLIERCLMRPRFLINLLNQCKSFAINFNHKVIEIQDIEKGLLAFSYDLIQDISYELRDVYPDCKDVLFAFIESKPELRHEDLEILIGVHLDNSEIASKIIELLLWYGFIGIKERDDEIRYIYNCNYNLSIIKGHVKRHGNNVLYVINPAFWPALLIRK